MSPAFDRRGAIDASAAMLMVFLTFSWGFNQVLIKIANTGYSPVFLTIARSLLASVAVYLWCRYRGIRLFERDGTLWPGALAGVLFGAEFVLIFLGLDLTTASRGVLMINTMPFWVLVGAHFLLGERMTPLKVVGLAMAFAGVALVFSDKLSLPDPAALRGDAMCLAAGALWAATTLVIKRSSLATAVPEKTLLYQLLFGAAIAVPLLPLSGPMIRDASVLATASLLAQAFYIVAFTYILWFSLVRRYPAAALSSFAFLSPVFGVVCGGLLLDEPLSARIAAALVLIAAGLVIVNRPARSVPPA